MASNIRKLVNNVKILYMAIPITLYIQHEVEQDNGFPLQPNLPRNPSIKPKATSAAM